MRDLRDSVSGASIASAIAGFGRYGSHICFAPDEGGRAPEKAKDDASKSDTGKKDAGKKDEGAEPDKLDKLMSLMEGFGSMMDSFSGRLDAVEKDRKDGSKKDEMSMPSKAERETSERQSAEETVQEKERDKAGVGDAAKKDAAKRDEDAEEAERKRKEAAKDDAAKADADTRYAAMEREIAELKARPQVRQFTDADHDAMVAAQTRADAAFGLHGKRAPIPLLGETPLAYRLRIMHDLKPYSDVKVDLTKIAAADPSALGYFEDKIYTDSAIAANNPVDLDPGELRPVKRYDAGLMRDVIEYKGRHTYVKNLSPVAQRFNGFRVSPKAA